MRLNFPIHTLDNQLLLPAGAFLSAETLEELISSNASTSYRICPVLEYGMVKQDLLRQMRRPPYDLIFSGREKTAELVSELEKVSLPVPVLQSLDYFKRDDYHTYCHLLLVFALSALIARDLLPDYRDWIQVVSAGPTHDIGKSCVPLHLLKKTTPLTRAEMSVIEHHTVAGYVLLSYFQKDYTSLAARVARDHHERKDGSGRPRGVGLTDRMVEIVVVCDVYDALVSPRPYRPAPYDNRTALEELTKMAEMNKVGWEAVQSLVAHNRKAKPKSGETIISGERRGTPPSPNFFGVVDEAQSNPEIQEEMNIEEKIWDDPVVLPEEGTGNLPEPKTVEKNLALLHILVNQSNDALFLVDPDTGQFLYVNDTACNNLGYTREELLNMGVLDIEEQLPELSAWREHVSKIREKGYALFEGIHKRKNRTVFPVEMNIKFVSLPKKNYIVAVARDISWRKHAEEALRESERQLVEAQRVARLGSWEWNITTNKVRWSEEVFRLFGISPEEFGARYEAFLKFVHPEDRAMLDRAVKKSVAEKVPYDIDARIVRPDGTLWIMYARGEVIYDEADNPVLMRGILQDITERKQAEAALRENEKLLRAIIDTEPECVKLISRDGSLVTMNPSGLAMIQADSLDLVKGQSIGSLVTPEYRDAFVKLTEDVFCGKPGMLKFRITGLKGRQLWLETHAVPLRDENGEVAFLLGVTRDITERMRVEQALLESEEKYRSLVESTDDSIYVVDRNYRYLHMNKKHMTRMGIGDAYVGRAYHEFHRDEETRLFTEDVDTVFETGQSVSREYQSNKDNKYFAQTLSPVKREAGQIVAVTIISKDITERKNLEEKLRALSLTDELTGLYNRRGFFAYCDRILKLCRREAKGAFLLYADLDNLKQINDLCGHHEGDKILVETAAIFKETFRESDIIARVGGDEFVVIPTGSTKDALELVTTRLRKNIENYNAKQKSNHTLSISFGTSYYDPQSPCSIDELVARAETLMYVEKRNKRS